jgi:hypothetical protein
MGFIGRFVDDSRARKTSAGWPYTTQCFANRGRAAASCRPVGSWASIVVVSDYYVIKPRAPATTAGHDQQRSPNFLEASVDRRRLYPGFTL